MHRIMPSATLGALPLCMLVCASIASAGETLETPHVPVTHYLFCTALQPAREPENESTTPPAIYYSAPFVLVADNFKPLYDAFQEFLQKKYAFTPDPGWSQPIQCYDTSSMADAETSYKNSLARSQKYAAQQTVIETGWTYSAP